jgi:5-methylcytosine-specific restriction endonuclease McrA
MANCISCNLEKKNGKNPRCYSCAQKERFTRMPIWNAGLTKEDPRMNYVRPTAWKKKDPRIMGKNQHSWKGGITKLNHKSRTSIEYQTMQKQVLERDDYTCQLCGARGKYMHVDHIQEFSEYYEGRFSLDNCRTLCRPCHFFITFKKVMPENSKWGLYLRREIN